MKTFLLASLVAACAALAGCNTIKGAGQDIQKAGSVIENAAKRDK
jgi:predicted small secreted protein